MSGAGENSRCFSTGDLPSDTNLTFDTFGQVLFGLIEVSPFEQFLRSK